MGAKEPGGFICERFYYCDEPTKTEYDWGRGPIEYEVFVGGIVGTALAVEQFRYAYHKMWCRGRKNGRKGAQRVHLRTFLLL